MARGELDQRRLALVQAGSAVDTVRAREAAVKRGRLKVPTLPTVAAQNDVKHFSALVAEERAALGLILIALVEPRRVSKVTVN